MDGTLASSRAVTGTLFSSSGALRIGGNNVWPRVVRRPHRRGARVPARAQRGRGAGRHEPRRAELAVGWGREAVSAATLRGGMPVQRISAPAPLGLVSFPDPLSENPYQRLLYDALAPHGFEVREGAVFKLGWLVRNRGAVRVLHFHWPQDHYRHPPRPKGPVSWAKMGLFALRLLGRAGARLPPRLDDPRGLSRSRPPAGGSTVSAAACWHAPATCCSPTTRRRPRSPGRSSAAPLSG